MGKKHEHKMDKNTLQGLLHMRSRAAVVPHKKGKGSFKRKPKHKEVYDD